MAGQRCHHVPIKVSQECCKRKMPFPRPQLHRQDAAQHITQPPCPIRSTNRFPTPSPTSKVNTNMLSGTPHSPRARCNSQVPPNASSPSKVTTNMLPGTPYSPHDVTKHPSFPTSDKSEHQDAAQHITQPRDVTQCPSLPLTSVKSEHQDAAQHVARPLGLCQQLRRHSCTGRLQAHLVNERHLQAKMGSIWGGGCKGLRKALSQGPDWVARGAPPHWPPAGALPQQTVPARKKGGVVEGGG